MKPPSIMNHRQCTIDSTDHLRQPTGLKQGRHQYKISSTVGQMFQPLVEIAYGHLLMYLMEINDVFKMFLKLTVGHKEKLNMLFPVHRDYPIENFRKQLTPFLSVVQSRGPKKDRRLVVLD